MSVQTKNSFHVTGSKIEKNTFCTIRYFTSGNRERRVVFLETPHGDWDNVLAWDFDAEGYRQFNVEQIDPISRISGYVSKDDGQILDPNQARFEGEIFSLCE